MNEANIRIIDLVDSLDGNITPLDFICELSRAVDLPESKEGKKIAEDLGMKLEWFPSGSPLEYKHRDDFFSLTCLTTGQRSTVSGEIYRNTLQRKKIGPYAA